MSKERKTESRDEVLFAFHQACERPTSEQIIEWTQRHPQFAEDIRDHAAVSWDMAAQEALPKEEPSSTMLDRGFSRVLNMMFDADFVAASQESSEPAQTSESIQSFQKMMEAHGLTVPKLAREIDIERGVLADLVSGRMIAPIGNRFVLALTTALSISRQTFDAAVRLAQHSPILGHAKADAPPVIVPQTYESIIRESSMTPERKQFWLDEE